MVKHSRRYSAVAEKVVFEKTYGPKEAMELLKEVSTAKFDETVELHIRTNVDPRHADQMIRGVCSLPHGLGKTMRVLVFAGAEGAEEARAAGARTLGGLPMLIYQGAAAFELWTGKIAPVEVMFLADRPLSFPRWMSPSSPAGLLGPARRACPEGRWPRQNPQGLLRRLRPRR